MMLFPEESLLIEAPVVLTALAGFDHIPEMILEKAQAPYSYKINNDNSKYTCDETKSF